ncbi:myosin head (motor domain) domain-containing protein, partial [Toxoplasma gondii p89]
HEKFRRSCEDPEYAPHGLCSTAVHHAAQRSHVLPSSCIHANQKSGILTGQKSGHLHSAVVAHPKGAVGVADPARPRSCAQTSKGQLFVFGKKRTDFRRSSSRTLVGFPRFL